MMYCNTYAVGDVICPPHTLLNQLELRRVEREREKKKKEEGPPLFPLLRGKVGLTGLGEGILESLLTTGYESHMTLLRRYIERGDYNV
jgi:hypothetical protein